MFKSAKVIGVVFQDRTGRHIHRLDSISMVWGYDGAFFEGRKYLACHPLDRNRLQMQDPEGLHQRKVNVWRVNWEQNMTGLKDLQLVKVWEDIDRILHLPTNKSEGCGGREDLEVSRLQKIECSIRVEDLHYSKAVGGSCGDCVEKWLEKVAEVATCGEFEGLKIMQRMYDLQSLVFSRGRK